MLQHGKSLSEKAADDILAMIQIDHVFSEGEKLPNEIEFSERLRISRTTLREAIRILVAHGVVEIRRGKGTFVRKGIGRNGDVGLGELTEFPMDIRDLYEMRLIFEPQAAYYAAQRATGRELERILQYGRLEGELIRTHQDRTEAERAFHKSIAKATHNEFMNRLMPILYRALDRGVPISDAKEEMVQDTLHDHRAIMDFMEARDPEGAKTAMKLHILRAMRGFGIAGE
ncbi:MAG: FadR family transcriptional regulator [Clostridiales bacterium]|nr:FadR family transcriptional regulator [Clostridiales bacterium]